MSPRLRLLLAILLLFAAGLRVRFFSGLQVGDDIVYSAIAAARADGEFRITNVHEARHGFLLPLTLAYATLGPGEVPLVLYNFLCSLGLVAACFFLARRFWGDRAGVLAGALAALHPNLVFFATECHTDTPVALWQALAVLALLTAAESERPRPLLVLSGLLVGWSWLHKEHAVFLLPFFAGHAIATKRRWTWYLPAAAPALAVFLSELAANGFATGDPFRRFAMVRAMHVGHYMTEQYASADAVLRRLFLEAPLLLFSPRRDHHWEGLFNLAGLVGAAILLAKRSRGAGVLAGWWASIFLAYCFWPSSLAPYLPAFLLFDWTLPPLAGPLLCLAAGAAAGTRPLALAAALGILALLGLGTMRASWDYGRRFADGGREAHAWLARQDAPRVITDDKTAEILDFLDGHRPARRYERFHDAGPREGAVVVVDKFWTGRGWWTRPITEDARQPSPSWRKVYESERLVIYRP